MNKPLIIGELGVNHQGSLDIAKKLIDMAKRAGVFYVKLQKRTPTVSTPKELWDVPKETPWGTTEPYLSYRQKMEFGKSDFDHIDSYCKQLGVKWFASVWDMESLDFMRANYDLPFIKVPSAKLTDDDLIIACSRAFPTILSTGMSTYEEVCHAANLVDSSFPGGYLLHCHSAYPAPDHELNLSMMDKYRKDWPGLRVGFSSHSVSPFPAIYAAAWGAEMIEVHCTLDRAMVGSDHAASLEPHGLQLVVREVNRLQKIWGKPEKVLWESEMKARKRLRGN